MVSAALILYMSECLKIFEFVLTRTLILDENDNT